MAWSVLGYACMHTLIVHEIGERLFACIAFLFGVSPGVSIVAIQNLRVSKYLDNTSYKD